MEQVKQGATFVSSTVEKRGFEDTRSGAGAEGRKEVPEGCLHGSYSAGRTISLGNFNFSRVTATVEYWFLPADRDAVLQYARQVVGEILEREVASCRGQQYEAKPLDDCPDEVKNLTLQIEYGLTINLGKFESAKVDVSYSQPIDEGQTVEQLILMVQDWCGKRVAEESTKIRKSGSTLDTSI